MTETDTRTIEIEVLRYNPETGHRAALPDVQRAVHRRHVGAAGAAVHQGPPRRQPHLPLVVPHGDLRQLRQDGERQARALLPHVPARLLPGPGARRAAQPLPGRARPRDRPERFLREEAAVGQAVHHAAARSRPLSAGDAPADAGADAQVLPVLAVHQLPALLRRVPAVRAQAANSPGRRRLRCSTATTPTRATAAGTSARKSSTRKKACGAARWSATAPRCARSGVDPAHAINQNKVQQHDGLFRRAEAAHAEGRRVMTPCVQRRVHAPDERLVAPQPVFRALHDPRGQQRVPRGATRSSCSWGCCASRRARRPTKPGARR